VEVPNAQDTPDCAEETILYSTASERPAPATVFIRVAPDPAIAPAVSVTDVWVPKVENTKSFALVVETPETVGAAAVPEHADMAFFGTLALVSKGETVFAPVTANSSPEAEVGVPLRLTVITSLVIEVDAIPYHSVCVVSRVVVHAV